MNQQPKTPEPGTTPAEPEIQQGHDRSIALDERLKRTVKRHPQRDEPKVDSLDSGEPPPA